MEDAIGFGAVPGPGFGLQTAADEHIHHLLDRAGCLSAAASVAGDAVAVGVDILVDILEDITDTLVAILVDSLPVRLGEVGASARTASRRSSCVGQDSPPLRSPGMVASRRPHSRQHLGGHRPNDLLEVVHP